MSGTKPEIIEKIKKLLRMKSSDSISEVENALMLAQKLAAKHDLDLDKINPDEAKHEPVTHDNLNHFNRISW